MPFFSLRPDRPISLSGMQDEMNHLIERVWHSGLSAGPFDGQEWAPPVDIYDEPERYVVHLEVPGVDPASINVTHVGREMTVRGNKPTPYDEESPAKQVRNERRFGSFCRTIDLPADVDAEGLSADCSGGILTISMPKSETSRPKSVKVNVEDG